ncbi:MAG: TlpA family protein disulfide reductase [Parcubacteria group bacterium]|nr:TlpA family protein disulfide reductase [Parcubacteria group bacterium]
MNKILVIIGILIIGSIGWLISSNRNAPEESANEAQFKKVPDFAVRDYRGKTVTRDDFRGMPLVINSWAVWCPFCREELADFARLQKEFGDAVTIIAIDRAEPLAVAKGFTDEIAVTNEMLFLLDPNDSFYRAIGGFSMPETVFVDANGIVRIHKRGPMTIDEMRNKVNQLLSY